MKATSSVKACSCISAPRSNPPCIRVAFAKAAGSDRTQPQTVRRRYCATAQPTTKLVRISFVPRSALPWRIASWSTTSSKMGTDPEGGTSKATTMTKPSEWGSLCIGSFKSLLLLVLKLGFNLFATITYVCTGICGAGFAHSSGCNLPTKGNQRCSSVTLLLRRRGDRLPALLQNCKSDKKTTFAVRWQPFTKPEAPLPNGKLGLQPLFETGAECCGQ